MDARRERLAQPRGAAGRRRGREPRPRRVARRGDPPPRGRRAAARPRRPDRAPGRRAVPAHGARRPTADVVWLRPPAQPRLAGGRCRPEDGARGARRRDRAALLRRRPAPAAAAFGRPVGALGRHLPAAPARMGRGCRRGRGRHTAARGSDPDGRQPHPAAGGGRSFRRRVAPHRHAARLAGGRRRHPGVRSRRRRSRAGPHDPAGGRRPRARAGAAPPRPAAPPPRPPPPGPPPHPPPPGPRVVPRRAKAGHPRGDRPSCCRGSGLRAPSPPSTWTS